MTALGRLDAALTHGVVVVVLVGALGLWMFTGLAGSIFRRRPQ